MEVFEKYIEKHSNYPQFIKEIPSSKLYNIIVIPCYNEPEILKTLDCLLYCAIPQYHTEVIIVINSAENSIDEIAVQNKITEHEIIEWVNKFNSERLKIHVIAINEIPQKDAGVGYARKTGMDEAIRRFILRGGSHGIISCLDADSTVEKNYLIEIEKHFLTMKNSSGCSIYFEHPVSDTEFSPEINKRIIEYELYLRYYKLALDYTGFPYYHYTIGSSFAVNPIIYCKVGGMNKKKAGEDFYFLHKVMPMGNYYPLNSTCVYPSPRPSNRVPFGTGAFINAYINYPEKEYLTYNFSSFLTLKLLFDDIDTYYKCNRNVLSTVISSYPDSLKSYLQNNDFETIIKSLNSNSGQLITFRKRFFNWFDAFRVLKFLNFVHQNFFSKELVLECLKSYLYHTNKSHNNKAGEKELLNILRNEEKVQV